jgi:recombinational DNA repair ATPase RecF
MRTLEPTPHEMPSGGADLRTTVLELADADEKLSEEAKLLILEALESDAGAARSSEPGDEMPPAEPANAYLKSISVKGFRGVGPDLRVPLNAGPGLVVISGRNGSGKSTIAEALELTLTGKSFRWHNRTAVWSQNWRNLHGDGDASIRLELAEENGGPITIGVDWAPGAELGRHSTWAQRPGAKRAFGADPLGWAGPLELYRPLLSYDELGGVLDGQPKDLYDKLNVLLGLDRITEAQQRLNERLKQLQGPQQDLKTHSVQVKNLLAGSDDERAQHASTLLAKYKKDIAAVEALAIGTQAPRFEPVQRLRGLAQLTVPTGQQVSEAAGRLRSAVAGMADRAGTLAEQAELHADLLDQALRLHDAHGEQSCPICGIGVLDSAWAQRTRDAMEQERSTRADLAAARSAVTVARREARTLIPGVTAPARVDGFDLPELSAAVTAFELWTAAPNDDLALADHLDGAIGPLTESYTALQSRAAALVTEHEDRWAPIAVQLAHWVDLARKADTAAPQMTNAKQAADWLKANTATLRNQRIAPLADRARHIWATLRQESNVDLGAIRLEGSANRRHVELRASVDGEEAGALGVMSQGELHALALALFLPRATAPESPFRFIVLDDPIQAMDPSKVEGFVRVMAELAVDRQVIVLSHDDRLADAVRRSSLKASMFEVTRGARSVVSVRETLHPAMRYLDDAWALTKDEAVPEEAKRRVVPGLCRSAFEAAAFEVYSAKSHGRGVSRITVEQEWEKARTVKDRLRLALGTHSEAQTTNWVQGGAARKRALYVTNRGVHGPIDGDLADDIRDLRLAIKDLREGRP